MRRRLRLPSVVSLTVVTMGFAFVPPARTEEVSFAGKTVQWIIPFPRGGGTDTWARVYAPYLEKYLPGKPKVVVKNAPGGAVGRKLTDEVNIDVVNEFHRRAQPDGLTPLGTAGSTIFAYLLGDKRVQYDFKDWHIILASPVGGIVYISPATGVKTLRDLKDFQGTLSFAAIGPTSADIVPLLAFEILGLDVKTLFAFKGRGPARLAFERGEVSIDYQVTPVYLQSVVPLVKAGKAVPLFSWGQLGARGKLMRDPAVPDLPHFAEAYQLLDGKKPSGMIFDCWRAMLVPGFTARYALWLPRGTPEAIVAAYRKAAEETMRDSDFQKNLKEKLGGYPQYVGDAARVAFEKGLQVPPESLPWLKQWLNDRFDVEM